MSAARVLSRALARPAAPAILKPVGPVPSPSPPISLADHVPPCRQRTLGRAFATPVSGRINDPVTVTSTLSNGLSISSETVPGLATGTIGVMIDGGSRGDLQGASGAAHFLEHMTFKGTPKRSQRDLEIEVENMGAQLNAYTSRETMFFNAAGFRKDIPKMMEILADILQNQDLDPSKVESEKHVVLREMEETNKDYMEYVLDQLHSIAYQGQPLGNDILGSVPSVKGMTREKLLDWKKTNMTADRMCIVGAGSVDHDALVKLAEKHFGSLPVSSNPIPLGGKSHKKPTFFGSDVRIRDDTLPSLQFAIAVEGCGWNHPDRWALQVLQAIFGSWDRSLGASPLLSSKMSHIICKDNLANSYMTFYNAYSDTSLWGVYMVTENLMNIDDLIHFTLKEWTRMSISPSTAEVERAKSQIKAGMLLEQEGSEAIADDIGRQMVTSGKRMTPKEIERYVDAVSVDDIKRVAQTYVWDKDFALAAHGRTEGLLDYNRIRSDMSSMLY